MTERFYSGRESWVYRARTLDELCGHHPDLMRDAMPEHDGTFEYLLYSPLRDTEGGPFGVRGGSGSHAVGITHTHLCISRDRHRGGERTGRAIPLGDILAVHLGEALTLGWFVVRFASGGQVASETVLFQSSGITHFRAIVRAWLAALEPDGATDVGDADPLDGCPPYVTAQVAPLIGGALACVAVGVETWHRGRCESAPGVVAMTRRALIVAESERPHAPGALVFGVNVVCMPRAAVVSIGLDRPRGRAPHELLIGLAVQSVADAVSMSCGGSIVSLERLVAHARHGQVSSC